MRCLSRKSRISSQILASSLSIFSLHPLIIDTWASLPFDSSFCSIDDTILHDARRAPITFLYATERRLRSSTVSSWSDEATRFMFSTISVRWRSKSGVPPDNIETDLHNAQPARRAWRGRQNLHGFQASKWSLVSMYDAYAPRTLRVITYCC